MKCSRCGREITVTEPAATGWEALGDGREVTCEACITLEDQGQIDATIIDITAGTDTEALFEPIRQEQADLAAVLEPGEPPPARPCEGSEGHQGRARRGSHRARGTRAGRGGRGGAGAHREDQSWVAR